MTKHANIAIRSELYCKESGYFVKKFAQSLDTFGFIYYLCTDISQGRILRGGRAKLGSITFLSGAFVILFTLFLYDKCQIIRIVVLLVKIIIQDPLA